jgi:hypothetical protein
VPAGAADVCRIATLGRIAIRATRRLGERNLAQTGQVVAPFALAFGNRHQLTIRVVVESLRLPAATTPMIAMTTIAPTTIQSHGTVLDVVVVVVVDELGFVVVADDEFGAVIVPDDEPVVDGPVVVVVLEPDVVPADCASVIAGAIARNSASRMRLSRKIGRMWCSPSNQDNVGPPCPRKRVLKTPSERYCLESVSQTPL